MVVTVVELNSTLSLSQLPDDQSARFFSVSLTIVGISLWIEEFLLHLLEEILVDKMWAVVKTTPLFATRRYERRDAEAHWQPDAEVRVGTRR